MSKIDKMKKRRYQLEEIVEMLEWDRVNADDEGEADSLMWQLEDYQSQLDQIIFDIELEEGDRDDR